jgi:uncharacterized membrane protein
MQNDNQNPTTNKTNTLAIVSLVLAFVMPLIGLVVAIVSLVQIKKTQEKGRGLAMAGLIISTIFTLLGFVFIISIFAATPALQRNARDTSRQNDVANIASSIYLYRTENAGAFPAAQSIDESSLTTVTTVVDKGEPTTSIAVYKVGVGCDGVADSSMFSVTVLLEKGTQYCVD